MESDLSLTLYELADTRDGVVHLDLSDMKELGVVAGDYVAVEGARSVRLQVMPAYLGDRNQRLARVSPLTAKNLGFQSGQKVRLLGERIKLPLAERVTLETSNDIDAGHLIARQKHLADYCLKRAVMIDDHIVFPTLDNFPLDAKIVGLTPSDGAQISHVTEFAVIAPKPAPGTPSVVALREIYLTCRSLLSARQSRGAYASARSVLLFGTEGNGKAHLVRRLAVDVGTFLRVIDLYSLLEGFLAQGVSGLESVLSELDRRGGGILLLDHLEALSDEQGGASLTHAKHVITSQLCALMDELPTRPSAFVFSVANSLDKVPDRLVSRFDNTLHVDSPNRWGRAEVLAMALGEKQVAEDVNLDDLADITSGMTVRALRGLVARASFLASSNKISYFDLMQAYRVMAPPALGRIVCDIPRASWEEVAGLDDIKQVIRETVVWSLYERERFVASGVRPPRSILLSGGQGTGKTTVVRALAAHLPMNIVEVSCAMMMAKHGAGRTKFLSESFALARRKAPCLLFFDDIDVLFEPVDTDADSAPHHHPYAGQLMAELDALPSFAGVVVFAATSRPDRLTPDVLRSGRFDFALTLPMPDHGARKKALQIHARKLPLSSEIDFDRLAGATQGMAPSEIANLCNRVGLMALRQSMATAEGDVLPIVTPGHFEQALRGRKS